MLVLSQEYISRLNAQYQGGIFLKAVEVVEDPAIGLTRYFVDHTEEISWNGRTYLPLYMQWSNMKTSQGMPIEAAAITLSNLNKSVGQYLKQIDITDNDVTMRLLHLDLLNETSGHWQRKGYILAITGNAMVMNFTVGRRLGRNVLPRKIYTQDKFPGLPSETARILT